MGAISMNLPAIYLPAGPMLRGNWNGQALGSGSDVWKSGPKNAPQYHRLRVERDGRRHRAFARHCMTMGTASTMTSIAEALGMTLPGASSIPAVDANHQRMAHGLRPPHSRNGLGRFETARPSDDAVVEKRDHD